jgi:hypothetical protein
MHVSDNHDGGDGYDGDYGGDYGLAAGCKRLVEPLVCRAVNQS